MKFTIRLIALLAALIAALSLAACRKKDTGIPDGYQLVGADENGVLTEVGEAKDYLFFVPASWKIDINGTATSAYVSSGDPATVSVMTWTPPTTDATPGDFWNTFVADFEKVYSDFAIESEADILLDGEAARSVTFTGSIGENAYRFRQITAIRGGLVYVLTYTNLAERFDEHDGDFDEIAGYFKFR